MDIAIEKILPNPEQPRRAFDQNTLEELADSIREHGLIQPVSVEQSEDGYYILQDGERRLLACKMIGMGKIPAYVAQSTNGTGPKERLERALVANIQREDMNIIEEGMAFKRLMNEHGLTREQICKRIGKTSHAGHQYINNRLDWANMDEPIQELVIRGKLPTSIGVPEALLSISDPGLRLKLARQFANRRTKIKTIIAICKRIVLQQEMGIIVENIPAMRYARQKASYTKPKPPPWDALQQLGKVPPWKTITDAARETCEACTLRDMASTTTCCECGVVEFLRLMLVLQA